MSFEGRGAQLNYYPCRYGRSRTVFRGPAVPLDDGYIAVLGGAEVYGRFVEDPFSDQIADRTGRRVVNLGVMNAGLDVFLSDDALMQVISGAHAVVIQALGAQNMSNRFYTVHPRRNDRFLRPSDALRMLYRDVDFSDFTFTRHMLMALHSRCPDRFAALRSELVEAWTARMRTMLSRIPGRRILLSLESHAGRGLGAEPLFVTPEMLDEVGHGADRIVRCDVGEMSRRFRLEGMVFPETDREVASHCLPAPVHEHLAELLIPEVARASDVAA
ncbi:DUF6473 family protein [Jannaschia sp. S6380]|uniref:DUF6473 family protein n=1 Tax=Jannaschia sp. S6380 TaxID=2926408 RepID=UPI001FF47904|nr:DUF6473 family protein [Jannaschia sp. S6380]MCK0169402.1 DUF6473 family protein [Jannaschia sp. S6380]